MTAIRAVCHSALDAALITALPVIQSVCFVYCILFVSFVMNSFSF
jgi:hypothetical protein